MEALMKFLTDTLIDPFTFDCSSQDKTDVDQFYKSYTQANYLLFDNQFRSSIEKIYQINHFPSFTSNHFKNFFWELLFYRPKEGLKLDEKYLRQKVVDIKGYKVPLTLAHILNTLLHRYTESDLFGESVWNWTPGIKSVFATTFCMVCDQMCRTNINDVTKHLLQDWFFYLNVIAGTRYRNRVGLMKFMDKIMNPSESIWCGLELAEAIAPDQNKTINTPKQTFVMHKDGHSCRGMRQALLNLKKGVVDHNNLLSSWTSSSPDCCAWRGISCHNLTHHVITLDLYDDNLDGEIGPSLVNGDDLVVVRVINDSWNVWDDLKWSKIKIKRWILLGSREFVKATLTNQVWSSSNCIEKERQALLDLKKGFVDDDNLLSSWTSSSPDCCAWRGVRCHNLTHHIITLDLHSDLDQPTLLGGEIGPSLLELQYLSISQLQHLEILDLSSNSFTGTLPESIGELQHLETLYLSSNSFTVLTEVHFKKLAKLTSLDLSDNSLTLSFNSTWVPPFQLEYVHLRSCKLGPQFPTWLKNQKKISSLDISNSIHDEIPANWLLSSPPYFLNLSSNLLRGPIPPHLSNVSILILSNNRFTDLRTFLCYPLQGSIKVLDISNNMLSGSLPDCQWNMKELIVLKLDNNNLSGIIPRSISLLNGIQYLLLGHNNFSGNLPSSLKNCTQLQVLDVEYNNLQGNIPSWIGEGLTNLIFLRIRSNHFYGNIPPSMCHLQILQIFDISINAIAGFIPSCIKNFTSMVNERQESNMDISTTVVIEENRVQIQEEYEIVTSVVWKGVYRECSNTLGLLRVIDLSSNNLTGKIPQELTNLVELVQLNLSRNNLNDTIPMEIGNLNKLDSLDLSHNKLSGVIPTSLASVSSLSLLDLSDNKLSGRIPTGTQLQSFNASVYIHNYGLYGPPLTNSCVGDESPNGPQDHLGGDEDSEDWIDMSWLHKGIWVGFVIGFVGVCGTSLASRKTTICSSNCVEKERQALLDLKKGFVDDDNLLSSWTSNSPDCCAWRGISCHNLTHHIITLDLYYQSFKDRLGGEIGPSLLELQHLRYLDFSINDFTKIPEFIGSLSRLTYLNFEGNPILSIPSQLGNLTRLQFLKLGGTYDNIVSTNLEWLSHLSSLRILRLSYINIKNSKSTNWFHLIKRAKYLSSLELYGCTLQSIDHIFTNKNSSNSLTNLDIQFSIIPPKTLPWLLNMSTNLVNLTYLFADYKIDDPLPNSLKRIELGDNQIEGGSIPNSLGNLCNLQELRLSNCNTTLFDVLESLNGCAKDSLEILNFSENQLRGSFPNPQAFPIFLRELFLSGNQIEGPLPKYISMFSHLKVLDVSSNKLNGTLPESIGDLQHLEILDLHSNSFTGTLPESIGGLQHLKTLHLYSNSFTGTLPKSIGELQHLEILDLSSNSFTGTLPESIGELQNLKELDLHSNSFTGTLPESIGELQNLKELDLHSNSFTGTLPESIGELQRLETLYLDSNSFSGLITEVHFKKLAKLTSLDLSDNSLTLSFNSTWVPPFQLEYVHMRSCKLGPQFPTWFKNQKKISSIDISNSQIHDEIPANWLLSSPPYFLNLSSNLLRGPIPPHLSNVSTLILSNNRFTDLRAFLCYPLQGSIKLLDISNNILSGSLPNCHWNMKEFIVLKSDNNNLSGIIPRSIGLLNGIQYLLLGHNNFSGNLPSSLKNCTQLQVLDVEYNNLQGNIPSWIGERLTNLIFLRIRSNCFYGVIPSSVCHLQLIKILDISTNTIAGLIPSCINNLTSMVNERQESITDISIEVPFSTNMFLLYEIVTSVVWKGVYREYSNTLGLLRVIDLSSNNLTGKIPQELTNLVELVQLNLSMNNLNDAIPMEIGNLKKLDSLDLSHNKLFGVIPTSLASISTLSLLDLSNNKLSGRIPTGTQLQSFDASVYIHNNGLWGPPLTNSCVGDESPNGPQDHLGGDEDSEDWIDMSWLHKGIWVGFVIGFVGVCGELQHLEILDLHSNSFIGTLPESIGEFQHLQIWDLHSNSFTGTLPKSISELQHLHTLSLDSNSFSGLITEVHFKKLSKLKRLSLYDNSLALNCNSTWVPPFQLEEVSLMSCKLATICSSNCVEKERQALLDLKKGFVDDDNLLSSWTSNSPDCCAWRGISCHNLTHHIITLDLYYQSFKDRLGGEIGPSLLELQHLRYLDFSINDFTKIPEFIGSLSRLTYLNFEGNPILSIPSQLGNLTRLQFLKLGGTYDNIVSTNLEWLSHLSSLRILRLSYINITNSKSTNWFHLIKRAKYLSSLELYGCTLQSIDHIFTNKNSSNSLTNLDIQFSIIPPKTLPWLLNMSTNLVNLTYLFADYKIDGPLPNSLKRIQLRADQIEGGSIPNSLGNLCNLQELRLWNCNTTLFDVLESLNGCAKDSLEILGLSNNQSRGSFPNPQAFPIFLRELYLSGNQIEGPLPKYISIFSHLKVLDVSSNKLNGTLPESIGDLQHLEILDLHSNSFTGTLPESIGDLQHLEILDLHSNSFTGTLPESIGGLQHLKTLHLYSNSFTGTLPKSIGELHHLEILDLSSNSFTGTLPKSIGELQRLKTLHLYSNSFTGTLPKSIGELQHLEELYLFSNSFTATLPKSIGELQHLEILDLSSNSFTGTLPESIGELQNLKKLDLHSNSFTGTLPESIGELQRLETLYLDSNSFNGLITEVHFKKLAKLTSLDLSYNSLTLSFNSTWVPPFQLEYVYLRSCKLGPQFPTWFKNQKKISSIDISNSQIHDEIPANWLLSSRPYFLNLSSNLLRGPIPPHLSNVSTLILSNNRFTDLRAFLCYPLQGSIKLLDISNNILSGSLPNCHWNMKELIVLKSDNNNLSGIIPRSIGLLNGIQYLLLGHNNFSGNLPSSLKNCTQLQVLDVEYNNLQGNIPSWIGERLTNLIFLRIRSNRFYGVIPSSVCHLQLIKILDISTNTIAGLIPSCINNLTSMVNERQESRTDISIEVPFFTNVFLLYEIVTSVVWKGVYREYSNTLGLLRVIDLSSNNLTGKIPQELTNLVELVQLNLSMNNLNDAIPMEIGNLKKLDSLDLSHNKLSGVIPTSLASISTLSLLDLSNNKLSGRIPTGTQLQSFDASVYIHNNGLWGPPLTNSYVGDESPNGPQDHLGGDEDSEDWIDMSWLHKGIWVGFVIGFVGVCGSNDFPDTILCNMRGRSYTPSPPRGYSRRGRSPSPRGRYGGRSRDLPTSLLVRNLRHDCRQDDLRRPFGQFGPLKDIYLPKDYHTGSRGNYRDRRRSPPRYSRSPPPRLAGSRSHSRDYYSPPKRRNYSRSVSPQERRYSRDRSYSRSPPYNGSRSPSRSPARGPSGARSPSHSRSRSRSPKRSLSRSPNRYPDEPNGSRSPSP
ncbi:hypothetical protein G4B88_026936 [Cannabis sativa]|uniref:Leucine-rich repeat-containing N-terminal plant-type domain-containing protein n=1 Tax=Cannabis sativa TaxID=3483 RepID=A0A7J6EGI7_CANSA|nr:hypothetical protein G4B88_026936 [Cannabis sativa]